MPFDRVPPISQIANELRRAAAQLEKESRRLRAEADQHDRLARKHREWRQRRQSIPLVYWQHLKNGLPSEDAIQLTARSHGIQESNVRYLINVHETIGARYRRELRNQAILRMKRAGYSNATIGEQFNLAEKTIPRIVKKMLTEIR